MFDQTFAPDRPADAAPLAAQHTAALQTAFGFTDNDLEQNQMGFISDAQAERVQAMSASPVLRVAWIVMAFVGVGMLAFAAVLGLPLAGLAVLGFVIAALVGLLLIMGNSLRHLDVAVQSNDLTTLEGTVKTTMAVVQSVPVYFVDVDGKRLTLSLAQYRVLQNGAAYRFYTVGGRRIIAVEALG
jgi:membrane protein YdbS with pleckstrin-like domain